MSAKTWPKIKRVENHGKTVFMVDARLAGKGERKFFPSKTEAETWAQIQRVRRANQGGAAFDDAELSRFGWSVGDAIKFALDHLRRQSASVTVAEAVAALAAAKRVAGMSETYCRGLEGRCGKLVPAFDGKKLSAIATGDLDSFLGTFTPGMRATMRRDICTLWSFGSKGGRKWCDAKVATEIAILKTVHNGVEILAPNELARLLSHAGADVLPGLVIAAYCGLRQAELEKLDWSKVDLAERIVTVDASIAKTSARRTVAIPENAVEWLLPYAREAGPVMAGNFRNAFDRVRVKAGFLPSFIGRKDTELQRLLADARKAKVKLLPWPGNGLRHSVISYKLAVSRDIAHVATESGNSPAIIRAHYLELVKPSAAKAYFGILPSTPANVLTMAA